MSASASSLFTNFHPFFVSRYEGREELCREIQARRHHCKPNQCKVTAVPALLFVHSGTARCEGRRFFGLFSFFCLPFCLRDEVFPRSVITYAHSTARGQTPD